jgi:cytochrome c peroxidase
MRAAPRPAHRAVARIAGLAGVLTAAALAGCGGGGTSVIEEPGSSEGWSWRLPAFFPTPSVPHGNPMSAAKVELGRYLFHDRRLSGNGTQACASCHIQALAFTDGRATSIGSTGAEHPRNAQGLANVTYNATLTWANPSLVTLEKQMETPLFGTDPVEMGVNDGNRDDILARLAADPRYADLFGRAYPDRRDPIGWGGVIHAIAAFQRTLFSGESRYDRYLRGEGTLSAAETRGMNLFFGEKAECFHCHGSFNFNDQIVHAGSRQVETPFHNTGLYNLGGTGAFPEPNRGVYELTQSPSDMGMFRAPSLRNVEVTGPYMHDGSVETLEDVLAFYAAGGRNIATGPLAGDGRAHPLKNDFIAQIDLSAAEQADIVAFLKALTDRELLTDPRFADPFVSTTGGRSDVQ